MKEMNAALQIVVALGAYCPRVKLSNEEALAKAHAAAKRRTRSMIGRGDYGKNMRARFDRIRFEAKQREHLKPAP